GGKWTCFHCQKKCHFKRDCPERKGKGDSTHVVEDSLDEGYEHAQTLVVSRWEPEKSGTQNSGDARDGGELGDFRL
ncbi:acylamino-acid-releasing enzyme, partial [Trifolium medium]|nr:acylamino-acid-releasing enzyme [Trifolium medium]